MVSKEYMELYVSFLEHFPVGRFILWRRKMYHHMLGSTFSKILSTPLFVGFLKKKKLMVLAIEFS